MLDFMKISTRNTKQGVEVFPRFRIMRSEDLMIRGRDFYAIWIEELGLWSTDEQDALRLIDKELDKYVAENKSKFVTPPRILYMWDADTGMIDKWHRYCQKQMRDNYHSLDETLIFSNMQTKKTDYASRRLSYPLEPGEITGWNKLVSTLYSEEERHKIEWIIGSIVTGASKELQKFAVMYGPAGTGKSTIIGIMEKLFEGYYCVFDSKALGSSSSTFALEAFKSNPLVGIQHDGDLSKIDDNTRLNSLVSHEIMTVNEKYKSTYPMRFNCFLIMGTNKPVKITDAKSGLIRRLIDISPTGIKLSPSEYKKAVKQANFELGAIACHCRDVYLEDPGKYDNYMPLSMLGASNDFYNFVIDSFHIFKKEDGTTLKAAWEMYKNYCDEANVPYPYPKRAFQEELKNYFWDYSTRFNFEDGSRVRSYYSGFRTDKFGKDLYQPQAEPEPEPYVIDFRDDIESIFEKDRADCPAQYATKDGTPTKSWDSVKTKLSGLNTSRLHYVKPPEEHVVIDFDIPDKEGNKCLELNLAAASKWPPTYAELSKSGQGIHLHYIYKGDPSKLGRVYDDHIEIKTFTGGSSLRRKFTKCNDLPIATISSGLPLKGNEKKVINFETIKSEKGLRRMIERNLNKEIHPSTKSSIDFIYKILEDTYASGLSYDISDMRNAVYAFAANSTNSADKCLKTVNKMQFRSEEPSMGVSNDEAPIVFYDIEVFPNLFLVNWKLQGEGNPVVRMINPGPSEIEELLYYRLIGFNCRRYDNHILYARLMGYDNEQIYQLSQRIINSKKGENKDAFFGEAYNISYTDVYDFASAGNKMSLKKWEIELGIHHQELGLPWDQPVPKERWIEVAEYCDNDVLATEAVFNHIKGDWTARQILADLAGMSVNDTTNALTTKIVFGGERKPQSEFNYRNLSEPVHEMDEETREFLTKRYPEMMAEPHGEEQSILPYFPGYEFKFGKSTYRGEEIGEGGRVYAEPGMYTNIALLDVASMHPTSMLAEVIFGVRFTARLAEIVDGRLDIKHEAWAEVNEMLDGKLRPYVQKVLDGEMTSTELANALKTAINSVYGLTSASFPNAFRDSRNKDNIVAKRGALFMTDLKYEVQKRGYTVAHIKTDSIKIPDADQSIIQFVMDFGKRNGYTFEHEATYDKMCLVNNAVYIARYKDGKKAGKWTATGAQFAVPYVFKTLFSHEPIEFADLCEAKSVKTAIYLDKNESLPDVSMYEKEHEKLFKKINDPKHMNEPMDAECARIEELSKLIEAGHNYVFVGKVGNFCPVKPGKGGGVLLAKRDNKYNSVTGATGYRWLEAEIVEALGLEDDIDRTYYKELVDAAVDNISQYGDFEWFVSDEPVADIEEKPPWED